MDKEKLTNSNVDVLREFKQVGKWTLNPKYSSNKSLRHLALDGIGFELEPTVSSLRDVIYLFKVDRKPIYIGQTARKLSVRMADYRYGFDKLEDTDNRVKVEITACLKKDKVVEIWIWRPTIRYDLVGDQIEISLSKSLESVLINRVRKEYELINVYS